MKKIATEWFDTTPGLDPEEFPEGWYWGEIDTSDRCGLWLSHNGPFDTESEALTAAREAEGHSECPVCGKVERDDEFCTPEHEKAESVKF